MKGRWNEVRAPVLSFCDCYPSSSIVIHHPKLRTVDAGKEAVVVSLIGQLWFSADNLLFPGGCLLPT